MFLTLRGYLQLFKAKNACVIGAISDMYTDKYGFE